VDEPTHGDAKSRRWIGLNEASRLLGVSPTTLRRWSDDGIIQTFTTPGGHRRFDARSVRQLLPSQGPRPTMERLGETPERMARAYRQATGKEPLTWVGSLDDRQRQAFRQHGQIVSRELLAYLDATTDTDRASHLASASSTAAQYGVAAAVAGMSAAETAEAFLRFRRPFLAEMGAVARRRGLDTAAATDLIGRASDAMDELLVATLRTYESERQRRPRGGRSADAGGLELPPILGHVLRGSRDQHSKGR